MTKLRLKFHGLLSRVMTHRKFLSLAMSFWPSRKIAQSQASQLFDIVSGFVYSQVLLTTIKLDLLEILREIPLSVETISSTIKRDPAVTRRLLKATTALELTKALPDDHFGLGKLGAAVITNPGLKDMVLHHEMFYHDMGDPLAILEQSGSTRLGEYWSYASTTDLTEQVDTTPDEVLAYSNLMQASQPMVTEQVVGSYDFNQHSHLLDIGGGTGQFLTGVRETGADLELTLFDLPSVVAITDARALVKTNIKSIGGDFFLNPLPTGADIMTLIRILHDHNDDAVEALLRRVFDALPNGGTLLIAEPLAGTRGAKRIGDAYFNFYFLSMGKGEARSKDRLAELLSRAGFSDVQFRRTKIPLICSVIVAKANK